MYNTRHVIDVKRAACPRNTCHVIDSKRGDSRHVNDRNGKEERKDVREILVTLMTVNVRFLVTLMTRTDNTRIGKTVWWSSR